MANPSDAALSYDEALTAVTVAESKGALPTGTYRAILERVAIAEGYIPSRDFDDYLGDARG